MQARAAVPMRRQGEAEHRTIGSMNATQAEEDGLDEQDDPHEHDITDEQQHQGRYIDSDAGSHTGPGDHRHGAADDERHPAQPDQQEIVSEQACITPGLARDAAQQAVGGAEAAELDRNRGHRRNLHEQAKLGRPEGTSQNGEGDELR